MLDRLHDIVKTLTSGVGQSDEMALFTLFLALFAFLLSFRALRRADAVQRNLQSSDMLKSGLQGKLAKLERGLNDLRTEALREIAILKGAAATGEAVPAEEEEEEADEGAGTEPEAITVPEEQLEEISAEEEAPEALSVRLKRTRGGFLGKLKGLFSTKPAIDAESLEELEGLLVSSDLGVKTSAKLLEELKEKVAETGGVDQETLKTLLRDRVVEVLEKDAPADPGLVCEAGREKPCAVLVVGINGVGKTTTVAKLAGAMKEQGLNVLVAAADTFRAAAVEQLTLWASKVDVPVVSGAEGARPQTIVFDAMKRAVDEKFDVVLIDTAGRLHTKSNLMQELEGISGVVKKFTNSAPDETILVLDGATGQNALQQAKEFHDAVPLTGIIVTKLDGTPKGGIVVAIKDEMGIPIRYIGVGESVKDLRKFNPHEFADAILTGDEEDDSGQVTNISDHASTRRKKRNSRPAAANG